MYNVLCTDALIYPQLLFLTSILNRGLATDSLEISVDYFLVLAGLGWLFEVQYVHVITNTYSCHN